MILLIYYIIQDVTWVLFWTCFSVRSVFILVTKSQHNNGLLQLMVTTDVNFISALFHNTIGSTFHTIFSDDLIYDFLSKQLHFGRSAVIRVY